MAQEQAEIQCVEKMIILYFNDKFFKWAPLLIESIAINEPVEKIAVFGLNLLSSQKKVILSFSNVKSFVEMKMEDSTIRKRKHHKRKNGERSLLIGKKAWYLRKIFKIFPNEDLYVLIDIDMLLLKPLTGFKKQMGNRDMAGSFARRMLTKETEKIKIAGGFLAFRPTKTIKKLLKEWGKVLANDWRKNQTSMAKLYRKYEKQIRFLDIDRKIYMDPLSKESSVLWSAHKASHGSKKERYKVYLAKLQKMRKRK